MTGAQRAALDAIRSARPIIARMSMSRHKEDLAADIIEAWSTVETGLRSLVGGSTLSGQALIREARQRQFLNFEQANALAEFNAARDRAGSTDYAPTEGDIAAAQSGYERLESGLSVDPLAAPAVGGMPAAAIAIEPVGVAPGVPIRSAARPAWFIPVAAILALLLIVAVGFALMNRGGPSAAYAEGVKAFTEGRREAAQGAFRKASLDNPNDPMPHVYLARMEREAGNLQNANAEAVKAVQLGPQNGAALRELASVQFALQKYDDARKFYIRAITADSTDRLSQGYLGCSLIRMGRADEGRRWVDRAGTGAWTGCVPAAGAPTAATGYPSPVPMTRSP